MNTLKNIQNLINKNKIDVALNEVNLLLAKDNNNPILYNLLGNIYFKKKLLKKSIENFVKAIDIDNEYAEVYFNIGNILHKSGNFKKAQDYLINANKYKLNYTQALYISGENYFYQGMYKEALTNFNNILNFQPYHQDSFFRVLQILSFYDEYKKLDNKSKDLNNANLKIGTNIYDNVNLKFGDPEKISDHQDLNYIFKTDKNIKKLDIKIEPDKSFDFNIFKKKFDMLVSLLPQDLLNHSSLNTQIIKSNENDLNCERHFSVFNQYNIIPKKCFSCFKIQIEPKNVLELIQLSFIFNNLTLKNNNLRKCYIELRKNIPGNYKGLIYFSDIDEMDHTYHFLSSKLKKLISQDLKIIKKRGCSEFSTYHPQYKNLDKDNLMNYDPMWKLFEDIVDDNILGKEKSKEKVFFYAKKKLSLEDTLVILNWLRYARNINDLTYKRLVSDDILSVSHVLNIQMNDRIFKLMNENIDKEVKKEKNTELMTEKPFSKSA